MPGLQCPSSITDLWRQKEEKFSLSEFLSSFISILKASVSLRMEYFTQWNLHLQKNLDSSTSFIPRKTSQNFSVACHLSPSTARKPQEVLFPSGDKHTERTKLSNHIMNVSLFPVSVAQANRKRVRFLGERW